MGAPVGRQALEQGHRQTPDGIGILQIRRLLEAQIEALIAIVDQIEGDPNLEDAADDERSLGWPERGPSALARDVEHDDREMEPEHDEDDGDTEPNGDELDFNGDETDHDGGENDAPGFIWGGQGL